MLFIKTYAQTSKSFRGGTPVVNFFKKLCNKPVVHYIYIYIFFDSIYFEKD